MKRRIKVGLLEKKACGGCFERLKETAVSNELLDNIEFLDIIKGDEKADFVLVQGGVLSSSQKKLLEKISRAKKKLILFGSCAIDPNFILGIKNIRSAGEIGSVFSSICGCPPSNDEIGELLKSLILSKTIPKISWPVCNECSENEIKCLLLKGEECDGPNTLGGCEVLCPKYDKSCKGCRTRLEKKEIR
ncbi:hypothetical protein GOV08_01905 [Candidatus Woesearchaeota archaeon]|nr:hypothetical protein [Candidatus Woesearchaeota archaeon]